MRDLEGLVTDQMERLRAEIVAGEKRQEKSLIAMRVMIDASVEMRDPARMKLPLACSTPLVYKIQAYI